uniref:Uncharacterized protein n=1 Tax=Quercus lobata TaxID=97700 RepID=A0A7N2LF18_QUELO
MANLHEVDQLPEGYLLDDRMVVLTTTPGTSTQNSTILGAKNNDMHLLGQGTLLQRKVNGNLGDDYRKFEGNKVGKSVHRRLLKKLNQGAPQVNPHQMKVRIIQRSLSIGSPRTPPIKKGDELKLKLERFQMRTLIINGSVEQHDQSGNHGGQGANTKSGSST